MELPLADRLRRRTARRSAHPSLPFAGPLVLVVALYLARVPANCQPALHNEHYPSSSSNQQPYNCPKECICLSATQILCNGGGLDQVPDDLPAGVEHLSLTKNNIRQLKTDAFQRYKSLRKLYLDGNAITHVQAFAFRGLTRLQELSLQNTPLERLGQFTFSGLHNVTNLYLANNNIKRIESYAFAGTSAIRLLVLTNNPTVRIDSSAFAGLSEVQMIYLPGGVRHLEQDAFNGLSSVGHLKLAHLDLQSLNSFVFRGLRHVQLLSIQESDLGTIRSRIFTNMSNVGRVTFINNKIDAIESLELTPNNRLRQFHFIGNHLLDLPAGRAIRIHGVGNVTVTNNHFPCDCRLNGWMSSSLFADQSRDHVMSNNFCISPYEVHGKSIMNASRDFSLLDACPDADELDDDIEEVDDEPPTPTDPSNLASSRSSSFVHCDVIAVLLSFATLTTTVF